MLPPNLVSVTELNAQTHLSMRILFFAHLQDLTGCAESRLAPTAPLSADAVWSELLKSFPGLHHSRAFVRLARNCEYASAETIFNPGDEIALIPPVSGG